MEEINIVAIDPSLRNTGYCMLTHNTETQVSEILNCGVLVNPQKFKGVDAVLNMIEAVKTFLSKEWLEKSHYIIVETPAPISMFQARFHSGSLVGVANIAGALAALIDPEKLVLVYPHDWNRGKKKEKTQEAIQEIYGSASSWKYEHNVKERFLEHVIDSAGMAHWFLKTKYSYD